MPTTKLSIGDRVQITNEPNKHGTIKSELVAGCYFVHLDDDTKKTFVATDIMALPTQEPVAAPESNFRKYTVGDRVKYHGHIGYIAEICGGFNYSVNFSHLDTTLKCNEIDLRSFPESLNDDGTNATVETFMIDDRVRVRSNPIHPAMGLFQTSCLIKNVEFENGKDMYLCDNGYAACWLPGMYVFKDPVKDDFELAVNNAVFVYKVDLQLNVKAPKGYELDGQSPREVVVGEEYLEFGYDMSTGNLSVTEIVKKKNSSVLSRVSQSPVFGDKRFIVKKKTVKMSKEEIETALGYKIEIV